ncbi:hypothetical protein PR048_018441 [Dryococelus australis]|uniref:Uncharacterized protein n=1 Tax=Dryococelus australis TaxID=614101 RepID=A0ABQ9HCF7_9NEOP|nr:hypothetical protein PR048_018441 [Dryococelus australis]
MSGNVSYPCYNHFKSKGLVGAAVQEPRAEVNTCCEIGWTQRLYPLEVVRITSQTMLYCRPSCIPTQENSRHCSFPQWKWTSGEPGLIAGGTTPVYLHVGIVPDDGTSRRVFSGISHFSRPFITALHHSRLASSSSALKMSMLRAAQISSLTHIALIFAPAFFPLVPFHFRIPLLRPAVPRLPMVKLAILKSTLKNIAACKLYAGGYGAAPECAGGETGDPRENSSSTITTCEDPLATPPGIEPVSCWWDASSLTTAPPPSLDGRDVVLKSIYLRNVQGVLTNPVPLSLWCNLPDLVKLHLHEAEEYPGSRTLAGLQKRPKIPLPGTFPLPARNSPTLRSALSSFLVPDGSPEIRISPSPKLSGTPDVFFSDPVRSPSTRPTSAWPSSRFLLFTRIIPASSLAASGDNDRPASPTIVMREVCCASTSRPGSRLPDSFWSRTFGWSCRPLTFLGLFDPVAPSLAGWCRPSVSLPPLSCPDVSALGSDFTRLTAPTFSSWVRLLRMAFSCRITSEFCMALSALPKKAGEIGDPRIHRPAASSSMILHYSNHYTIAAPFTKALFVMFLTSTNWPISHHHDNALVHKAKAATEWFKEVVWSNSNARSKVPAPVALNTLGMNSSAAPVESQTKHHRADHNSTGRMGLSLLTPTAD